MSSAETEVVCVSRDDPRLCAGYHERYPEGEAYPELPSTRVLWVIGFGEPVSVGRGERRSSFVAAPRDRVSMIGVGGLQHGIRLRLDPLDAFSLFGVPMRGLGTEFPEIDAVLGRQGADLTERLFEAGGWRRRFAVLDAALARLRARGPKPDPGVAWAWRRIAATGGTVRISGLADELSMSRRHLARRFHDQVGMAPKTAARILRFERAAELVADPSRSFAQVAAETGYADQAHFTRELRALTLRTPGDLRSQTFKP
ncbi:helix-turn-helix domain-containing protein [Amycolatopsis minnesotensis]|uniref:AraC family transcriptional regulator n=1 Tax=Amycolatopsis minnesotensis TaxID=337894 RepID=A0ABP5BI11_9PSEU